MTLEQKLRLDLANKWTKYVRKDTCEICGSTENLDLHHEIPFTVLLEETLNDLNLEYNQNIEFYTEEQLMLIEQLFIGKHYYYNAHLTLCKRCHSELHKTIGVYSIKFNMTLKPENGKSYQKLMADVYWEQQKKLKEISYQLKIKDVENYLKNIIGKRLLKEDREKLIDIIDSRIDGHKRVSLSCMNKELEYLNLPYVIISESARIDGKSQRYWKVTEVKHILQD